MEPIYFQLEDRTVMFSLKDVPSYEEALEFCRLPDTFGISHDDEFEFLVQWSATSIPAVITSRQWHSIKPGHILTICAPPQANFVPHHIFAVVVSRRAKLVDAILRRLKTVNFIQIRGSPASGKTTLLHLIHRQLEAENKTVLRLDAPWPTDQGARKELYRKFNDLRRSALETETETVVFIDEGQATYADSILWNTYFKIWAGDFPGPFGVIIACAYGSASPHIRASGPYTSLVLEDGQRIGLRPQEGSTDTPLGLLFDEVELDEIYALAVATKAMPPIDKPLKELIFTWTEGYISVVSAIAKTIGEKKQWIRDGRTYTLDDFIRDYPQENLLQTLMANDQCRRLLPNEVIAADPRVIRVFSRLFVDGAIEYEPGDQLPGGLDLRDIDFAHEKGLLYTEGSSRSWRITFAFPLQRALLQMSLCPPIPDISQDTPTLFSLITEVIQRFNADHLSTPKRVGGLQRDRPLDATYQHEFYRCLYQVRPRALVSAEYSTRAAYTPAGRIDFLLHRQEIVDKHRSWGIELLRDGDRIREHAYRFDPNGAYHSMVSDAMTEFKIIDFRTSVPTKVQPSIPDLLHVVFTQDYASATFYDNNNIKCGYFPLVRQ
ncbi:hypothetical protein FB451DRAFT_1397371 [Mycena latifolia]|nr:hypothetical protein FB451DRAFT_1397371 [Mycena latifolia]